MQRLSTAILSLPLIQVGQLSVGHLVLVNRLGSLPRNSVNRLTDRTRNHVNSVEEP